jgi:hypothetical protein
MANERPEDEAPAHGPGVYPAVFEPGPATGEAPSGTSSGPAAPPPRPGAARRGLLGIAAAAAVAVGALVVKFGLPLLVGAAAGGLLDGVFGGPFEKVPEDQRQALQQRLDAAFGDRLDGKSADQVMAEVDRALSAGLPRLGDAQLVDRLLLSGTILRAADVPTCATIARASASGLPAPEAMASAIEGLPPESIARWFDINVSAIEAELAGAPPLRTADPAQVDRIAAGLITSMDPAEAELLGDLYGGQGSTMTDDDACGGVRALYDRMVTASDADRAVLALYDVSP